MSRKQPPKLAADIVGYYLQHPRAADTLEGIARWRLLNRQIDRTLVDVDQALDWLVARGLLIRQRRLGTAPLFSLNGDRLEQAKNFVDDNETGRAKGGR